MRDKAMHGEHNNDGSLYMTLLTVFLYLIARLSLTEWAAIATIFAALSTMAYNLYRMFGLKKKKDEET